MVKSVKIRSKKRVIKMLTRKGECGGTAGKGISGMTVSARIKAYVALPAQRELFGTTCLVKSPKRFFLNGEKDCPEGMLYGMRSMATCSACWYNSANSSLALSGCANACK